MEKKFSRRDFLKMATVAAANLCLPPIISTAQDSDNIQGEIREENIVEIERGYRGMITMVIENYEPGLIDSEDVVTTNPPDKRPLLYANDGLVMKKIYNFLKERNLLKNRPAILVGGEIFPIKKQGKSLPSPRGFIYPEYWNKMNLFGGIMNFHPAKLFLEPPTVHEGMNSQDMLNYYMCHESGHTINQIYPSFIQTKSHKILVSSARNSVHLPGSKLPHEEGYTDIYPYNDFMGGGSLSNYEQMAYTPLTLFLMGLMTTEEFNKTEPYFLRDGEKLYYTAEDLMNSLEQRMDYRSTFNAQLAMQGMTEPFKPGWMLDKFGTLNEETGQIEVIFDFFPIAFRGHTTEDIYRIGDDIEEYLQYYYRAAEYLRDAWDRSTNGRVKINIVTI